MRIDGICPNVMFQVGRKFVGYLGQENVAGREICLKEEFYIVRGRFDILKPSWLELGLHDLFIIAD